ncbi:MAG: hypothetical protein FD135_565 [Comamonadaceae bacterium]|nr:MAG: hypothetical protein FD135_565 [Comamonadaceae bacterium]
MITALGLLSACGGGGGSTTSSNTTTPALAPVAAPTLSPDQSIFESQFLSPSLSYNPSWLLPNSGTPVNGTHYLYDSPSSISASPLTNGTQSLISGTSTSLASTLTIVAATPTRYLIGGQIFTNASSIQKFSYSGTGIKTDIFASNGTTLLSSAQRSGYQSNSLTGLVTGSPAIFARHFNALFSNPSLLNTSATWGPGSAYFQYTETNLTDKYLVFDTTSTTPSGTTTGITTGTTPTPVATGTTIAALMASGGITNSSDGITYTLANGSVATVNGVNTYTATAKRQNVTGTRYRTYYDIGGNVLTGELIKAGDVLGGSIFRVTTGGVTSVDYSSTIQIRLNKAANDSLKAALTF